MLTLEEKTLPLPDAKEPLLIPRFQQQGYDKNAITARRKWVEDKTGISFEHVSAYSLNGEELRGNIENPIGSCQVPLGIAGPLAIHGSFAQGIFYVPFATTEGALVRSYERGMVALTRAGGVSVRVYIDENKTCPVFFFPGVSEAHAFATTLNNYFPGIKSAAEATTRHGKLLRVECQAVGRQVMVTFCFYTADAHGMNMIVKATESACRWIIRNTEASSFYIFSGMASEKHSSGALLQGGKGKKVVAGALLPFQVVKSYLHVTPAELVHLWRNTVVGHLQANALGYNGHYANGLAAMFIACGQDVANIVNSAVGITNFELVSDDQVYVTVTLPSLTVATVGGGTGLGTGKECLQMMGVAGKGGALKLAEITAATLLAGEISIASAIASGEFVKAHEDYGRNRPES